MKHTLSIVFITLFPFIIGITMNYDDRAVTNENESAPLYPEHIAGAYTGGFGEQSCHSCHFDYDLNQPEGELEVTGIKNSYEPGQEYTIQIYVKREDMNRAGFQMTARFEDGSQAGHFEIDDELTTTPNVENNISYIQHGVGKVEAEGGEKNWKILWKAPTDTIQLVVFNIAANAANGDASEFGDWIYLEEIKIEPGDS